MSDVVLLGAGASADAGVATAFRMTKDIGQRLERAGANTTEDRELAEAFKYVCRHLRTQSSSSGVDVERVFSAVCLLAERDQLEISPFVKQWCRGVTHWEHRDREPADIFARLATRMVTELRDRIAMTSKRVGYLKPLLRAARADGIRIATLNYDRAIEVAGKEFGIPVTTSIESWMWNGEWLWHPDREVCLLKLHGSIDWAWIDDPPSAVRLPSRFVAEVSNQARRNHEPVLIFGLREKLRAEGPFLDALTEFESWLSSAQRLIVVGYSFRDDHVNQVIRRWTFDDRNRELVLVDPSLPSVDAPDTSSPFRGSLLTHLSQATESGGQETRLRLVEHTAARAFAGLFPDYR